MSRLVDVDIRNVKLQKTEMKLVANGLVQEACCISLNLTNCSIGDGGCEDLAKGLVHCKTLRELLLCKNKIGDRGARALAEVFRNSSISVAENKHYWRVIDMSYNHIGDSGAMSLAESLKHMADLDRLDLKCNKIGDTGAVAITKAIMDNKCLLKIWPNHRITENGSRAIVNMKPDVDSNFHVLNISGEMSEEVEVLLFNMQDDDDDSNNIKDN